MERKTVTVTLKSGEEIDIDVPIGTSDKDINKKVWKMNLREEMDKPISEQGMDLIKDYQVDIEDPEFKKKAVSFLEGLGLEVTTETLAALAGAQAGAKFTKALPGMGKILGPVIGAGIGYAGARSGIRAKKGETGTVGEELVSVVKDTYEGSLLEGGGQVASKAAKVAVKGALKSGAGIKKLSKKVMEYLSGVPTGVQSRFVRKPKGVLNAIKQTNAEGAQGLVKEIKDGIQAKVSHYDAGLNRALKKGTLEKKTVSLDGSISTLKEARDKIIPSTPTALKEIKEISNQINLLEKIVETKGVPPKKFRTIEDLFRKEIGVEDAQQIKRQLQAEAYPVNPDTGFKFKRKDITGKALRKSQQLLTDNIGDAVPDTKLFNKKIKEVIDVQADPNFSSYLGSGKKVSGTIGSYDKLVNNMSGFKDMVKKTDDILGTSVKETGENFFAAKFFRDPTTGKSLVQASRSVAAPIAGSIAGGYGGELIGGEEGKMKGKTAGLLFGLMAGGPGSFRLARKALFTPAIKAASYAKEVVPTLARSLPYAQNISGGQSPFK